MNASLADDELRIVRTFDAPASLVFSLWAEPRHFRRWMGPETFTCPEAEIDFRVGGAYRVMIQAPDGDESWFGGVYREIERDRKLVFTFTWAGGPSAGHEMLVTITFEAQGDKTVQTFHQRPFRSVDRRNSNLGGWSSVFNKLAAYAAKLGSKPTIHVRCVAP